MEPSKIEPTIKSENLTLQAILTTHHHADHAGGNPFWTARFPSAAVYGGDKRISNITNLVQDGDSLELPSFGKIRCIKTPGHTSGHVCFYLSEQRAVFTGDCLFLGGCGRMFEGTAAEMLKSLDKLGELPDDTLVYCGHEYTLNNLKFATTVEQKNEHITKYLLNLEQRASMEGFESLTTIPGTIGNEKLVNPFMRTRNEALQTTLGTLGNPEKTLAIIRKMKDEFH